MNKFRRIFIAIPLPLETRNTLKQTLIHINLPGNKVPEEKWHFTLAFLGNVAEEKLDLLYKVFTDILLPKPFSVSLSKIDAFPNSSFVRVLWVGVEQGIQELMQFNSDFKEALLKENFSVDTRSFIPHVTISRFVKPNNISDWMETQSFRPITTQLSEVILMQSILNKKQSLYIPLLSRTLT